jgi:hypothetical protein
MLMLYGIRGETIRKRDVIINRIAAAIAPGAVGSAAQAARILSDDPAFDVGTVVVDKTSGLTWLAPIVTRFRSYSDVLVP